MNLVQSEIHARLRHGLTQTELAREFGIAICTLNNILKGHREPSAKVLKLLGIKRQIVYVLEDGHDIPEGLAARAPLPRGKRRKVRHAPVIGVDVAPAVGSVVRRARPESGVMPALTTERVLVAVKFKLNPRETWTAFLDTNSPLFVETIDADWQSYCEGKGSAPSTAKPDPVMYASLGNGDAVALKPVTARQDFRRVRKLGELPAIATVEQPEAIVEGRCEW